MTARQPDDPGPHGDDIFGPKIIFGSEKAELTPNTLKLIRKNAGRVSPLVIAQALRWSIGRLMRVARAEGIALRYPPASEREAEPRGA